MAAIKILTHEMISLFMVVHVVSSRSGISKFSHARNYRRQSDTCIAVWILPRIPPSLLTINIHFCLCPTFYYTFSIFAMYDNKTLGVIYIIYI